MFLLGRRVIAVAGFVSQSVSEVGVMFVPVLAVFRPSPDYFLTILAYFSVMGVVPGLKSKPFGVISFLLLDISVSVLI